MWRVDDGCFLIELSIHCGQQIFTPPFKHFSSVSAVTKDVKLIGQYAIHYLLSDVSADTAISSIKH